MSNRPNRRVMIFFAAGVAACAATNAPCPAQSSWPAPRHDNRGTGLATVVGTHAATPLYADKLIAPPFFFVAEPVVDAAGTVYLSGSGGGSTLPAAFTLAIDPRSGTVLWTRPGGKATVGPTGLIYVVSVTNTVVPDAGTLTAYNPDGTIAWTYTTPNSTSLMSRVTVADDGRVFGAYMHVHLPQQAGQEVQAYRFALSPTGQQLWHVGGVQENVSGGTHNGPLITNDGALIWSGGLNGNGQSGSCPALRRIDPADGHIMWAVECQDERALILPNGLIVVRTSAELNNPPWLIHFLQARSPVDGHVVWTSPSFPDVTGGSSALGLLPNGRILWMQAAIYSFSPTNGALMSTVPYPAADMRPGSQPVVGGDGTLYMFQNYSPQHFARLWALDPLTGAVHFQYPQGGVPVCRSAIQPALLADGGVFMAYNDKTTCNQSGYGAVGYFTLAGRSCGAADVGRGGGLPGADGTLDNNDFVVFVNDFFAGNAAADVGTQGGLPGHDNAWDNNDFVVFVNSFFTSPCSQ